MKLCISIIIIIAKYECQIYPFAGPLHKALLLFSLPDTAHTHQIKSSHLTYVTILEPQASVHGAVRRGNRVCVARAQAITSP